MPGALFSGAAPMEDMTEIRHAMYQRGFSILPISGKRPPMDEWQKLCANSDAIALWPRLYPFAGNTGVHTRDTPAIDADIFNEEAAEAIEALARASRSTARLRYALGSHRNARFCFAPISPSTSSRSSSSPPTARARKSKF